MTTAKRLVAAIENAAEEMACNIDGGKQPGTYLESHPLTREVALAMVESDSDALARYLRDVAAVGMRATVSGAHGDGHTLGVYGGLLISAMAHLLATGYGVSQQEELERMAEL